MTVGIPGTGLGGLFYFLLVALMPFYELLLTLRGRSSLARWRRVAHHLALLGAMFNVYPTMGELPLIKGFALVIMGGMGSVGGVFAAGLILGVAEGLTAGFFSTGWVDVVAFGTLIIVLLIRPEGLSAWGRRRA